MKTTFVENQISQKEEFPCFRKWLGNDPFKGSIVVFSTPRVSTVIHLSPSCKSSKIGDVITESTIFSNLDFWAPVSGFWAPVSGILTIEMP